VKKNPDPIQQTDHDLTVPSLEQRYERAFYAALAGFCCNPSLGDAHHEELAAAAAERVVSRNLDIHPSRLPNLVV
jgi:hypothetical protein